MELINENYAIIWIQGNPSKKQYKIIPQQIGQSLVIDQDYNNLQGLNCGHLCPSGHQSGNNDKTATFTLTNIVSQYMGLNQGARKDYENQTTPQKTKGCDTTYVIWEHQHLRWEG
ncbi:hypothetical protein TURU_108474 [Turdus rufiventris]|nr:hypothetical protein TURU_108474 [Turdus rufiventris]